MKQSWMPETGERLVFVSTHRPHHVHFFVRGDGVEVNGRGDVTLRLELNADGSPTLTEAENLAVAILRKDELAALAAADDILERFNRPDGFKTRDELKAVILELKGEIERGDLLEKILRQELRDMRSERDDLERRLALSQAGRCPNCRTEPCVCSRKWPVPTPKVTL